MTTPQVHLIMLGLGLLAYVLITGFRSSRTSISRQHRRRWWLGVIAATAVALSPLSQFWRKPFNSIDLLTQSLLISAVSLLGLLIFSLLLTPFKAVRRIFRRRHQSVEHVLTRNDTGLSPIAIDAESGFMSDNSPIASMIGPDPQQSTFTSNISEKSIAETINESGEIHSDEIHSDEVHTDEILTDIELTKTADVDRNVDQLTTKKLDVSDIESVVPLHGKSESTPRFDEKLSRSAAANDKMSMIDNQARNSVEHAVSDGSKPDKLHPTEIQQADDTLRLDEVVDETLKLDELADDTLRLDEPLPNGAMSANGRRQVNDEKRITGEQKRTNEQLTNDELQTEYAQQAEDILAAEEMLLAEDGLMAVDELDIASIPSEEESLDLSDTGNLFSEIRSQQTEIELPDDKELREASQPSALDELDLSIALLEGDKSEANKARTLSSRSVEIEEANVIDKSTELGAEEADLEFGNDLTGEYAHPADEYAMTPEQAAKQAPITEQLEATELAAKRAETAEPATEKVTKLAPKQTVKRIPEQDVLVVHHNSKEVAEPKTLAAALVAAKLTADSVESQVSNLEKRIAKLDGFRNASINFANTNAEQHTVALEHSNVLLTCEDEARRAAESVIKAQKAMLERAQKQQAEVDALLEQERKHLRLLKSEVERSRKMARTAALLARKAAVAQQEIRNVAKREQTARLKSEESTRKAVNIARNAINALAEEERKRDLTQH